MKSLLLFILLGCFQYSCTPDKHVTKKPVNLTAGRGIAIPGTGELTDPWIITANSYMPPIQPMSVKEFRKDNEYHLVFFYDSSEVIKHHRTDVFKATKKLDCDTIKIWFLATNEASQLSAIKTLYSGFIVRNCVSQYQHKAVTPIFLDAMKHLISPAVISSYQERQ